MRARVLMIDNYDSFTYNLVQYLQILGADVDTRRNDAITPEHARDLDITHLVVSPGPGTPRDAGRMMDVVEAMIGRVPILGVCLGHQAIGEIFGAPVHHARCLMHGKASLIRHDGRGVYQGLPSPTEVGRYHSLSVHESELPAELNPTAWTDDGELMGVRHATHPLEGVQFHPESVLTTGGLRMIANFLGVPCPDHEPVRAEASPA